MRTDYTEVKTAHLRSLFIKSLTPVQRAVYTALQASDAWQETYILTGRPLTYEGVSFALRTAEDNSPNSIESVDLTDDQVIASGTSALACIEMTFEELDDWATKSIPEETIDIIEDEFPFSYIEDDSI